VSRVTLLVYFLMICMNVPNCDVDDRKNRKCFFVHVFCALNLRPIQYVY